MSKGFYDPIRFLLRWWSRVRPVIDEYLALDGSTTDYLKLTGTTASYLALEGATTSYLKLTGTDNSYLALDGPDTDYGKLTGM